eukprot:11168436-Lingulodinium_polyedra.AAC.1
MELSVSESSGWRLQQSSVIAQYASVCPAEYGRAIASGATVVSKDSSGDPVVGQDGAFIIDVGNPPSPPCRQ